MASSLRGIPLDDIPNTGDMLIHLHSMIVMDPYFTYHDSTHVKEFDASILDEYPFTDNNS